LEKERKISRNTLIKEQTQGREESKKTSASRASTDPSTAAATLSRGELVSPEFLSRTGGAIAFSPAYSVP